MMASCPGGASVARKRLYLPLSFLLASVTKPCLGAEFPEGFDLKSRFSWFPNFVPKMKSGFDF